jgi:hypothetical protein
VENLSAPVLSENLSVADRVGSPFAPTHGLVAILDALGARNYGPQQVDTFLQSRKLVLDAAETLLEKYLARFNKLNLKRFAFQDTVIICYIFDDLTPQCIPDFETACHVLRAFQMLSLTKGILFRGAYSVGELYRVDEKENIVMGPAVSDAASWYEKADWIGIHATPKTSNWTDSLIALATDDLAHLLVNYNVPMKSGEKLKLRAVNWPKGFYVADLAPAGSTPGRAKLQSLLSQHPAPHASDRKHFNAIKFFDFIFRAQKLKRLEQAEPSPAASEAESEDAV